jgi:disulfide oxidoreductase YuzD
MLIWATKVADKLPNYIEFVKWWDLKNIQDEDKKKKKEKIEKEKLLYMIVTMKKH